MVNLEALISRFCEGSCDEKHNDSQFCKGCAGIMESREGFLQCCNCGLQGNRTGDGYSMGFDNWREFSGSYTRRYRFLNLLKDLNGWGNFPDECVEVVWERKNEIKNCVDAKKLLTSDKIFRKHQNQVSTVMRICEHDIPSLGHHEIERCCNLFTKVDMRIGQLSNLKAAFTYLLPVILRLIGRTDWEKCGYLKKVSPLLEKKYGGITQDALKSLNLCSSMEENSKETQ